MRIEETYVSYLDVKYSYNLAKRMEQERTNSELGYRTAGSLAEYATGDMLRREMEEIGLQDVSKDAFMLDGWEFKKAVLKFRDQDGVQRICQMGAYQTNFVTEGFQEYSIVYLGKGGAVDYEGVDVKGKLVLVEMNQRDEWWISFPVFQAYVRGAAALVAVQVQGYGEAEDTSLNAQDIAGPEYAPAFSMSQSDARVLKDAMKVEMKKDGMEDDGKAPTLKVWLDAESKVERDTVSYNIVGKIPGEETDSMIIVSAHYDSYFEGFQDDNAAVGMMMGIARALIQGNYRPRHTLVFCAMAAEEWGVIDSKYDWSTGAYRQVFNVHPEWQGHVIANLNFELPAHAHQSQDAVRSTYEYADFLQHFVRELDVPAEAYPDGMTVVFPIETWSDDFSMAIAGIPSMVNEFSSGRFMQDYYHSQYDNEKRYQEPVYQFHHECYLKMVLAFDKLLLPPLNFSAVLRALRSSIDSCICKITGADEEMLMTLLDEGVEAADELYQRIRDLNEDYEELCTKEERIKFRRKYSGMEERLLRIFRKEQDYFVRLNWHDEVIFPQETMEKNIPLTQAAIEALENRKINEALTALYQVDNNRYAFQFDEEVYNHFTDYILNQSENRLMWGAGRIMHYENLYQVVHGLKEKLEKGDTDLTEIIVKLEDSQCRQKECYLEDVRYIQRSVEKITRMMKEI